MSLNDETGYRRGRSDRVRTGRSGRRKPASLGDYRSESNRGTEIGTERLEERLERERQRADSESQIGDIDFPQQVLSASYETLPETLREIIESDTFDRLVRKPIEGELYSLASRERVEYERGHGWRLTDGAKKTDGGKQTVVLADEETIRAIERYTLP